MEWNRKWNKWEKTIHIVASDSFSLFGYYNEVYLVSSKFTMQYRIREKKEKKYQKHSFYWKVEIKNQANFMEVNENSGKYMK